MKEQKAKSHKSKQFAFLFDQSRCNGCKTCEVACIDYHDLHEGVTLRSIYDYEGGSWFKDEFGYWSQDVFCYYLSLSCNHCANPVCVRYCTNDAISKDENGFVVIDNEQCVGCQACMMSCPYHAPRFNGETGTVVKCDGCRDRVAKGIDPICISACPQRALTFDIYQHIGDDARVSINVTPLADSNITQPNFLIKLSPLAKKSQGREGKLVQ